MLSKTLNLSHCTGESLKAFSRNQHCLGMWGRIVYSCLHFHITHPEFDSLFTQLSPPVFSLIMLESKKLYSCLYGKISNDWEAINNIKNIVLYSYPSQEFVVFVKSHAVQTCVSIWIFSMCWWKQIRHVEVAHKFSFLCSKSQSNLLHPLPFTILSGDLTINQYHIQYLFIYQAIYPCMYSKHILLMYLSLHSLPFP